GDRLSVVSNALDLAAPRDNFALRAVGASASAPNKSCLLPFLNLPIDFEQSHDLVLFEHGSKRGVETLFLAVLMAAAPRFRRQRFDFRLCPPQPILERLRLRCSKILGLNHLHTLEEAEETEKKRGRCESDSAFFVDGCNQNSRPLRAFKSLGVKDL